MEVKGLRKRKFRLHNLQTVVPDAGKKLYEIEHLNEVTGPVFKIKDDPWAVGSQIRKMDKLLIGTESRCL